MPGSCAVVGCLNRFERGGKHFYRFPKNDEFKLLWVHFTRRGDDFVVKKCSAICEDHFAHDRIIKKKKGRFYLMKNTVPTIYRRGNERVVVDFDPVSCQYNGDESFNLLRQTITVQEEKQVLQERRMKIKEMKNLCRFCFESQDEKFVAINKLEAYFVNPDDMIELIGVVSKYNEVYSEIVCEQCFQQIVAIDGYRKRCCKAQEEIINELEDLDLKIQNFQAVNVEICPWFKEEPDQEEIHHEPVEIIEEHLDDNISYVCEEEETKYETYEELELVTYQLDTDGLIVKEEPKIHDMEDLIEADPDYDMDFENEEQEEEEEEDDDEFFELAEPSEKDIYNITDTNAIIQNPDRNTFALRIYECFFCRLKFAGKKTYKAHECQVKEVKCEVVGCEKYFNKLSGYNTHVVKVHSLLKTSKHFCPICKNVIMSTENQFKLHCRKCVKASEKNDSEKPIECEICKKQCLNLRSYTVHKLFHDSKNLVGNERGSLGLSKAPVICEHCGKEFTNSQGLRTHKKNVHRIGQPKDIVYQCDICSKMRPTKRSLFNHMRNVHRVRKAPCTVCGKIFRTPALLQKHMMYHDETKRIHICPMCPNKPGWFTNVALKRHQKTHHQTLKAYQCSIDFCDAHFSTTSMLKQHKTNCHDLQL